MKHDLAVESGPLNGLHSKPADLFLSTRSVRLAGFGLVVVFGFIRAWVGRYSMNPDGMCYLDLGQAFFHRRWFDAVNGYWSPLYAWLLEAGMVLLRPSRWQEFPVAHAVNFAIYLATFLCFEYFLRSLITQLQGEHDGGVSEQTLGESSLRAIGYALFLWTSLDLITIFDVSPDLCVAAFVYLIGGLLLRIQRSGSARLYIVLGAALGFAYLTKAVMFPLGFAFIACGFGSLPREKRVKFLALAMGSFLMVSAPWLVALSRAKGRLTFGDSGALNYSVLVSPGGRALNWQGEPPSSGVPVHTTRKLLNDPPLFEFASPLGGTYPPSFDPSYWDEGRKSTFDMKAQLRVISRLLVFYAGVFLRDQPGLLAAVLTFLMVGGAATRRTILRNWFLLGMCVAAMGLYVLVHSETRFIGAYVTVFWLAILAGVRLPPSNDQLRMARYLAIAAVITILLAVIDNTVHAIWAGGPYSARDQIVMADDLNAMGLRDGDQIAVVGDGNWCYWAHSAKLKIVSTIMSVDMAGFWRKDLSQRKQVYRVFAETGARALVAIGPLPVDAGAEWTRVGDSPYYLCWLSD
jgi:hypothetical protein